MMNDAPTLQQAVRRLMIDQIGPRRTAEERAAAAIRVYETLLNSLSPLVGSVGSQAMLRRSLKLTEKTFPFFRGLQSTPSDRLLTALSTCLAQQEPDVAMSHSILVLTTYVDLLTTFIGERLTRQLLHTAWPDALLFPSQETSE
jgi:hypothetical protein